MKLKTGLDPTERVHVKDSRGLRFCGMGAFVGRRQLSASARLHGGDVPGDPGDPQADRSGAVGTSSSRSTCARSTAGVSG